MFRGVATALVAMAAFDLYVLDGRYVHAFQSTDLPVLHFFGYYVATMPLARYI
jgi:hypothetical protein